MDDKKEIARAYITPANNIVIVAVECEYPIIGLVLPDQDKTTFSQDFAALKSGDIPITAAIMQPHDCYKFCSVNDPHIIIYDDGTSYGRGAGDPYFDR